MAIDWNAIADAGGIPKGETIFASRKSAALKAKAHERIVYAQVTTRDNSCCRVCAKWCNPRALSLLSKAHHHHLVYRSQGGVTETWNVTLLCADCHEDEHQGRLQLSGNADLRDAGTQRLNGIKVERPIDGVLEVIGWR